MDPVSAILLAMAVAGYFTKNIYQDSVFKARGQDPPSYRRQQERAKRRAEKAGRAPVTDRQEARRFWVNAWEDAWESAEERRARAHAKKLQERRRRWSDEDLAAAEDEAYGENQARDKAAGGAPLTRCEVCSAEVASDLIGIRRSDDGFSRPVQVCPRCAARIDAWEHDSRKREAAADPAAEPSAPDGPKPEDLPDTEPEDRPAPRAWPGPAADHKPEPDGATVFRPDVWNRPATTQEDPFMSAESHNLAAALAYTHDMATQSDAGVASTETSIAGMTAGGVTGDAITAMHAAQEALAQAAVQFRNAHAELEAHIAVKEAYQANQGAGERQYVITD